MIKVKLDTGPLYVQQSRYFQQATVVLMDMRNKQLGYVTVTITNHGYWYNLACEVYMHGRLYGESKLDVHDGADYTDTVLYQALERAGLELVQP